MRLREHNILLSLWKWKLLSSAALADMWYPDCAVSTAYRKLWDLKQEGLICAVPIQRTDDRSSYVWSLTKKGFHSILADLPGLKAEGHKSETPYHDHLVTAIHLGEWLKEIPAQCALFSEQELRCLHVDQYPEWVPHTDIHRPDGYWRTTINGKGATIALEVELTRKSGSNYRGVGQFYSNRERLYRIIWVVPTKGLAFHIQKEIKSVAPEKYALHSFILLNDFLNYGWEAKFFLSRELDYPMRILFGMHGEKFSEKLNKPVCTTSLLNTLKSPHKSTASRVSRKIEMSDRVGYSTLPSPLDKNLSSTPSVSEILPSQNNTEGGPEQ